MLLLVCRLGAEVDVDDAIVDQISVPIGAQQSHIENRVGEFNAEAQDVVREAIHNEGLRDERSSDYWILKGFRINPGDVKWIWNRDFPGLWAANKRGTLMGWRTGDQHLYAAYYSAVSDNEQINRVDEVYGVIGRDKSRVGALSEGQLEALCSEYLRRINDGYVELISVGGSLSDADIFAGVENDSREIISQVTFETSVSKAESKFRRLAAYGADDSQVDLWYFGPEEVKQKLRSRVPEFDVDEIYKPIEEVFEEFEDGLGPEYLDLLLGIDLTSDKPPAV